VDNVYSIFMLCVIVVYSHVSDSACRSTHSRSRRRCLQRPGMITHADWSLSAGALSVADDVTDHVTLRPRATSNCVVIYRKLL